MIQNMEPFTIGINVYPFIEKVIQRIQYMDGKKAIKRSDRVMALSKFVCDLLVTRWNIPKAQDRFSHFLKTSAGMKRGYKELAERLFHSSNTYHIGGICIKQ